MTNSMINKLLPIAASHINNILTLAIKHSSNHAAVVVFDDKCVLSTILTAAYRQCLPTANFIDFNSVTQSEVIDIFNQLKPGDLVVLIQSTNFRLNAFRIRVELFNQSLKVIEHPHLERMKGIEVEYYIEALAYDSIYFRETGHGLKRYIDSAQSGMVKSGGEQLFYNSPFESAKLNIGDYTEMKNIGGQFPIGEVFTETKDLEAVNGRVNIFAFGDTSFSVNKLREPITLVINKSKVIETINSTSEFDKVLENIRADEGEVWMRELGFGLNRAFTAEKTVADIGTYERMCGIHLSLGAKHAIYKKAAIKHATARHHVDVFAVTEAVFLDNLQVYKDGYWVV